MGKKKWVRGGFGMQPDSPDIIINGSTRVPSISDRKPYPNWSLIDRGAMTDGEIYQRFLMLDQVKAQMISSPQRRLIPPWAWDELVEFSIWRAVTTWKGNGEGRCPLKNYAWRILQNTGRQYWKRNKHMILDCHELDRPYETPV